MPRPTKLTVDYFPHYANASEKKTLYILEVKFGIAAYAFWFKLLEILASTPGHYFRFNNPAEWEFLTAKTKVSHDIGRQILEQLALLGAIDKELYEEDCIWSQNLVDGLSEVYRRRQVDLPRKPSFNRQEPTSSRVSDDINPPSPLSAEVSTDENTQRKGVEVLEEAEEVEEDNAHKKNYGEFKNVPLADKEYEKLIARFGEDRTKELIESLSSGIKSKGYKYKDHYATILSWERREQKGKGGQHGGHGAHQQDTSSRGGFGEFKAIESGGEPDGDED